jgi:hypothetical protein
LWTADGVFWDGLKEVPMSARLITSVVIAPSPSTDGALDVGYFGILEPHFRPGWGKAATHHVVLGTLDASMAPAA